MADPLSIAASCIAVMTAVGQTTRLVRDFVRTYRNARADLVRLSQEMSGLDLILQSLHDIISDGSGMAGVPEQVQKQLGTIISDCGSILDNTQAVLDGFVRTWAETKWVLTGKRKISDQVALLEVNRKALDLALSTINFSLSQSIKKDTTAIRDDTANNKERLDEILQHLKAALPETVNDNDNRSEAETVAGKLDLMSRFLGSLGTYTTSLCEETTDTPAPAPDQLPLPPTSPRPGRADNAMARFLFAILQQKCLKDVDWNKVAHDPTLTQSIANGHRARMRYSCFRNSMLSRPANLNSHRVSKDKSKKGTENMQTVLRQAQFGV